MPDRYMPDNLDEIIQRVYEHGVVQKNTKCSSQGEHDKQKGESEVRVGLARSFLLSRLRVFEEDENVKHLQIFSVWRAICIIDAHIDISDTWINTLECTA